MWLVWLACLLPPLVAAVVAPLFVVPQAIWLGAGLALPVSLIAAWFEQRGVVKLASDGASSSPLQALQGIVVAMLFRMFVVMILIVVMSQTLPDWNVMVSLTVAACLVVSLIAGATRLSRLAVSAARPSDETAS